MSLVVFREIDGVLTPTDDGIPLCAESFREEARRWVERQNLSAPISIIVGLGAGHHVRAWLEANPDAHVIVVDSHPELIKPFIKANPDLQGRYDILIIDSLDGLLAHEILGFVAESLPPVMAFRPAFGARQDLFDSFFATLTGRNHQGLRYFLDSFGFKDDKVLEVSDDGRLLTIKDLGLIIDAAHEGNPKASAVRVLRELVV